MISRLAPSLAALLACAALAAAVLAAPAAAADTAGLEAGQPELGAEQPGPKPQLLLIHGGSFLFHDPFFRPLTRPAATEAGFVPHYLNYPLADLPAAIDAARREARELRRLVGVDHVYVYGTSAGGTLAAILAGEGDVEAAVAKAPVSDLATWEWPLERYGPDYYEAIVAGPASRLRLSPVNRPEEQPLLVIQGRQDGVVPPAMNEAFAAKFRRVHLWLVPGGHTTERVRPWVITGAMGWLQQIAARHAPPLEGAETLCPKVDLCAREYASN